MSPELITAIALLATTLSSIIGAWMVSRRSAKKDDLETLRQEITRLQGEVNDLKIADRLWRSVYSKLFAYALSLQRLCNDHDLPFPPMPQMDMNGAFSSPTYVEPPSPTPSERQEPPAGSTPPIGGTI